MQLEQAATRALAKTFENIDGIDDLNLLRVIGTSFGVDFNAWTPAAGDLEGYSDAKLRKMPAGKAAPKELKGEKLQAWLVEHWGEPGFVPKEFAEPKPKAARRKAGK